MRLYPFLLLCLVPWGCDASRRAKDSDSTAETGEYVVSLEAVDFARVCGQTTAQACDACKLEGQQRVDDCFDTCNDCYDSLCVSACISACERISSANSCSNDCPGTANECSRYDYEFIATGAIDPAILEACEAAVARDEGCSEQTVLANCDRFSRIERPEAAAAYTCVAAAACGEPTDGCFEALGSSSLGERATASCMRVLGERKLNSLDHLGAWVRPEVQAALDYCGEHHCSHDFSACVDGWIEFAFGN